MAVSMNVDYTRQIYTGLSTDDWGGVEFHAGDVVYIMDQSQCWIFDGSTMQQLPDLGGGGGGGLILKGSGSYTQTTDIASASQAATIPVAGIDSPAILFVDSASVIPSYAQTKTWYRQYYIEEETVVAPVLSDMLFQYINYNSAGTANRSAQIGRIYYNSEGIKIMVSTGGNNIKANTYYWYWWQKEE